MSEGKPPEEGRRSVTVEAVPPSVDSQDLLRGGREVLILHAGQTYRLRVTAANKLILVK